MDLEQFSKTWIRSTADFPKVWLWRNGFVVRDVSPDLDKYVVQHMLDNFAHDAPMFKSIGILGDPVSLAEMTWVWRDLLIPQRVSLVVLKEGTPGADLQPVSDENPPNILGANVLSVTSKGDKKLPVLQLTKGARFKRLFTAMQTFTGDVEIFERFGVDHYVEATGLSVGRDSRGLGLGQMLLEARLEMCRSLGIPFTKTIFTAVASQKLAAKVGFTFVKEKNFQELVDHEGKLFYPDLYHSAMLGIYKLN